MTDQSWNEVEDALKRQKQVAHPVSGDSFWADFRAQAADADREPAAMTIRFPLYARWGTAVACAAALLIAVGIQIMPGAAGPEYNEIISVEVPAEHSGLWITTDEATECTILWVVDMETEEHNGGNS